LFSKSGLFYLGELGNSQARSRIGYVIIFQLFVAKLIISHSMGKLKRVRLIPTPSASSTVLNWGVSLQ
jgi:hypothetical protein